MWPRAMSSQRCVSLAYLGTLCTTMACGHTTRRALPCRRGVLLCVDWTSLSFSLLQVITSDGVVYTTGQNRGGACGRERGPNPKDWAKMFTKVGPAALPPGVTGVRLVAGKERVCVCVQGTGPMLHHSQVHIHSHFPPWLMSVSHPPRAPWLERDHGSAQATVASSWASLALTVRCT